jgi:hypothetical protein
MCYIYNEENTMKILVAIMLLSGIAQGSFAQDLPKKDPFDPDVGMGITWFNTDEVRTMPYLHVYADFQYRVMDLLELGGEINLNFTIAPMSYFAIIEVDCSLYGVCSFVFGDFKVQGLFGKKIMSLLLDHYLKWQIMDFGIRLSYGFVYFQYCQGVPFNEEAYHSFERLPRLTLGIKFM